MGDIKKLKKKYQTSAHPWIAKEIEEGKVIKSGYGLRKRKEILISSSFLKKYKDIAKSLIARKTVQSEKEKVLVLNKLQELGLLPTGAALDQILGLQLKDVLERRLQSIVCRKGLARSMNQARQFIVYRHISIGEREITFPSYLVSLEEEGQINFKAKSPLAAEDHPERLIEKNNSKTEEPDKKAEGKEGKSKDKSTKSTSKPSAESSEGVSSEESASENEVEELPEDPVLEEMDLIAEES